MSYNDITITALSQYKNSLDLEDNYCQFDTVQKIEKIINHLKNNNI
jgi:hypothetical protein